MAGVFGVEIDIEACRARRGQARLIRAGQIAQTRSFDLLVGGVNAVQRRDAANFQYAVLRGVNSSENWIPTRESAARPFAGSLSALPSCSADSRKPWPMAVDRSSMAGTVRLKISLRIFVNVSRTTSEALSPRPH